MYNGGLPENFPVDLDVLLPDENVLAIQIHNVNENSSDMSAIPFLLVGLNTSEEQYRPLPSWFSEPFEFESSDIPIFVIDTQGKTIRNEPKTMVHMGIIAKKYGQRNHLNDAFNEYNGNIGIELRGNASLGISDKKPFTFETRHEDGSNNNVSLLGMPDENDWILRAGYIDKTFCRDALGYHMSRLVGRWAPRTRHVEVVLNGNYEGIYILEESIKPDAGRLDIATMDATDISGFAVTGGYIWEVAQSGPDFGNRRRFKYPKSDDITPEQIAYIRDYDNEFRRVMTRQHYDDPQTGYPAWIDVDSFIDEILVQEATGNSDAYGWSSFFHKDRGGKLCAGPVWDFDQALSNSTFNCGDCVEEWTIEKNNSAYPAFWKKLWYDSEFKERLADRWFEYREGPWQTAKLVAFIDSLATYLDEAQERNFKRWPILGVEIWRSPAGVRQRDTYQKEVDYMKEYFLDHIAWMDDQLTRYTRVERTEKAQTLPNFTYQLYPNPTQKASTLVYGLPHSGHVTIKVYNSLGQLVRVLEDSFQENGTHVLQWDGLATDGVPVARGLYFYTIQLENKTILNTKILCF